MSEGLNRVMLLGNLGADPEYRVTSGGSGVLNLRLAVSETYLDKNKARQERTEWATVIVFGKRAEALGRILSKGSRIFVEGSLRTTSYEAKDGGGKRYKTEVVANNIILNGGGQRQSGGSPAVAPSQSQGGGFDDADYGAPVDDMPF